MAIMGELSQKQREGVAGAGFHGEVRVNCVLFQHQFGPNQLS